MKVAYREGSKWKENRMLSSYLIFVISKTYKRIAKGLFRARELETSLTKTSLERPFLHECRHTGAMNFTDWQILGLRGWACQFNLSTLVSWKVVNDLLMKYCYVDWQDRCPMRIAIVVSFIWPWKLVCVLIDLWRHSLWYPRSHKTRGSPLVLQYREQVLRAFSWRIYREIVFSWIAKLLNTWYVFSPEFPGVQHQIFYHFYRMKLCEYCALMSDVKTNKLVKIVETLV